VAIAAAASMGGGAGGGLIWGGAPLASATGSGGARTAGSGAARLAGSGGTAPAGCNLANGIKHVIEITFDNVHFFRDNPKVLSDIEQMPALMQFMTGNGTVFSNNHTPLIAHTANDTITNYTGLYGDRNGIPISNDYEIYRPSGTVAPG
jgi:hypothetical protein